MQPTNPKFSPWMLVAKRGNNRTRTKCANNSRQNHAEIKMTGKGLRFRPHMNIDDNDERFISLMLQPHLGQRVNHLIFPKPT